MNLPDTIERSLELPLPRERVWQAITNPEQLSIWFSEVVEMDLRVGGHVLFVWGQDYNPGIIEVLDAPERFAFRWISSHGRLKAYDPDHPSTLVTITLTETPQGTHMHLLESGFSSLPESLFNKAYADNDSGWTAELNDLTEYLGLREGRA